MLRAIRRTDKCHSALKRRDIERGRFHVVGSRLRLNWEHGVRHFRTPENVSLNRCEVWIGETPPGPTGPLRPCQQPRAPRGPDSFERIRYSYVGGAGTTRLGSPSFGAEIPKPTLQARALVCRRSSTHHANLGEVSDRLRRPSSALLIDEPGAHKMYWLASAVCQEFPVLSGNSDNRATHIRYDDQQRCSQKRMALPAFTASRATCAYRVAIAVLPGLGALAPRQQGASNMLVPWWLQSVRLRSSRESHRRKREDPC